MSFWARSLRFGELREDIQAYHLTKNLSSKCPRSWDIIIRSLPILPRIQEQWPGLAKSLVSRIYTQWAETLQDTISHQHCSRLCKVGLPWTIRPRSCACHSFGTVRPLDKIHGWFVKKCCWENGCDTISLDLIDKCFGRISVLILI